MLAGCSLRNAEKKRQAICDSINAEWPICVNGIELEKVSCADWSYTIHITLKDTVLTRISALRWENETYYADEERYLMEGSYGAPDNVFIRELMKASKPFDEVVCLLSARLWNELGGESTQGYLPLYVVIKDNRGANDSIKLLYNDCWL